MDETRRSVRAKDEQDSPEPTGRERIAQAAVDELAEHGFAGVRVSRLARAARINSERIYAYFGDRKGLLDHVLLGSVRAFADAVGENSESLDELAQRILDYFTNDPKRSRILAWARLEAGRELDDVIETQNLVDSPLEDQIRRLQDRGVVAAHWHPRAVFQALVGMCDVWASAPVEERVPAEEQQRILSQFVRIFDPAPPRS